MLRSLLPQALATLAYLSLVTALPARTGPNLLPIPQAPTLNYAASVLQPNFTTSTSPLSDTFCRERAKISNTDMTLFYSIHGFWTYPTAIAALLTSTNAIIQHQVKHGAGASARLLLDADGNQAFHNHVRDGKIDIRVENIKPYAMTWKDMSDLVLGLKQECWLQLCAFEFALGNGVRIGKGALYSI